MCQRKPVPTLLLVGALSVLPLTGAQAAHAKPGPTYRQVVPTSEKASQTWKYTLKAPPADWFKPSFGEAAWKQGRGGFGTNPPGRGLLGTKWSKANIWLRRPFNPGPLTPPQISRLVLRDFHDEDIDVYINGVRAYSARGFITAYEYRPLSLAAKQSIRPDATNEIAVHCHQTTGGQYIDVGIFERN